MDNFDNIRPASTIWDKGKLFIKSLVIFGMSLGLWIPTFFIHEVVKEREHYQKEAIADISSKWAGEQELTGPILALPFEKIYTDSSGKVFRSQQVAYLMPDKQTIRSVVTPEKRKRGIYEVAVFKSDIQITGVFTKLQWSKLNVPADQIHWADAKLLFKVSDAMKGINEDLQVKWNASTLDFGPWATPVPGWQEAYAATVPVTADSAALNYSIQFKLNGSGQLQFASNAHENTIRMQSNWPDPAFNGVKLPDIREVSDSGFTASWKYLNRNTPMISVNNIQDLSNTSMGADLLIPVDTYDKSSRSVKYALLCILLTFAAFFLVETVYKRPLHLVQYGLAGLALVLFYTLLLSVSEYTGFNIAYLIAGIATIGLVGWFVGSILRSRKLAVFIGMVLTIVYGYIFSIIQLQDYALLMGSIGLFVALAIIMYFSRKLEW